MQFVKYYAECGGNSGETKLLTTNSLAKCAEEAAKVPGTEHFIFGIKSKEGRCYTEPDCIEGQWDQDDYNVYKIVRRQYLPPGVVIRHKNKQCIDDQGTDVKLKSGSFDECAKQCSEDEECRFFKHGHGAKEGQCYSVEKECKKVGPADFTVYEYTCCKDHYGSLSPATKARSTNFVAVVIGALATFASIALPSVYLRSVML